MSSHPDKVRQDMIQPGAARCPECGGASAPLIIGWGSIVSLPCKRCRVRNLLRQLSCAIGGAYKRTADTISRMDAGEDWISSC